MEKCQNTQQNKSYSSLLRRIHKHHSSAGTFYTSSAGTIVALILLFLFSFCLSGANTHSVFATASTLSLSIDNTTVGLDISSISSNGTFAKSSNSTISASTNNATGYTLSIAGNSSSDYNKLINNDDTNAKLNSITEATTESQFSALSGTAYNNMWGYLPSKYCTNATDTTTCTTNTDFLPAPSASGDILDVTSAPNSTANEYQLAIGARVDSSTKIGAYTNTFNVILVGNAIPYTMTFNDTTISNMPTDIDSTSMTETVNIPNNTPTKSGYTFIGWCTVSPTTVGLSDACTGGTQYAPNDPYVLDQTGSNNVNFYTMWKRNTMQNVSEWGSTIPIGGETTAIDTRDGNVYSVARLCMSAASHTLPPLNTCDRSMLWMTQNLDLALGPQGSQTLTNTDSDLNSVSSWTPDTTTMQRPAVITNHANGNPVNSVVGWTNSNSLPYWGEGGDYYVYTDGLGTNETHVDNIYNSLTACIAAGHTENDCRHYHVGNYYNWSAAVASNDTSGTTSDLTVMPNSICPKGWRLPNGLTGSNGNEIITEFNQLALANGVTADITTKHNTGSGTWVNTGWVTENSIYTGFIKFRSVSTNAAGYQAPLYFVRSGLLNGTTLFDYGTRGYLWSSTSQSQTIAYYLVFYSTIFHPAAQDGRYLGLPVRCVARD